MSTVPPPPGSTAARQPVVVAREIPTPRPQASPAGRGVSLAGSWRCVLDREETLGVADAFANASAALPIDLPGTLNAAGIGDPLALSPSLDRTVLRGLHLATKYLGVAWFQRTIHVPRELADRPLELSLERVLGISRAWIDATPLGECDSLSTPHLHGLAAGLCEGPHTLTLRIDNRLRVNLGGSHAYTDETQGLWHGVAGAMTLRARGVVRIARTRVRPNLANHAFELEIDLAADPDAPADGTLTVLTTPRGGTGEHASLPAAAPLVIPFSFTGRTTLYASVELGPDARAWDEFDPHLYDLHLTVRSSRPVEDEETLTLSAGLRQLVATPGEFLLNGRPHFLRGTLECCVFPKTAHPPCDVADWKRIYDIARAHGLNHLRFHSYCPPAAAFVAADEAGFVLQVELPNWSFQDTTPGSPLLGYLDAEGHRILDTYGNHPSFALFAMGNELPGDFATWDSLLRGLRAYDDRPLYSSTAFSFSERGRWPGPDDAFYITQQSRLGWTRGQGFFNSTTPSTDADFAASVAGCPVPVVSHEVGQYTVYPDLRQLEHYTGPMRPINLEAIRDDLARRGLLGRAADFTRASGRLSVELYREDVERALRTPGLSGIQLLGLHDFPGQSTALIGLLDAFWNDKGLVDPGVFRQSCGPVTLLLRLPRRVYESHDRLVATLEIANFGPEPIENATIDWSLIDDGDETLASGSLRARHVPLGRGGTLGTIEIPLGEIRTATSARVRASLRGTDVVNAWRVWIYPPAVAPEAAPTDAAADEVLVHDAFDDTVREALRAGRRVLLLPARSTMKHRLRGQFVPVFWSPLHFPAQPGTQGILCDPSHPALADFPTADHADWQWWDLTRNAAAMVLDTLPGSPRPIVQFVDHFARNNTPGLVWEAQVGPGRLMVCTLDLAADLAARPVARQLRRSLLAYLGGPELAPAVDLDEQDLAAQFKPPGRFASARVVHASSFHPGHEPEAVLDDDPQTFWHNDWSGEREHPHEIVIDLGSTRGLAGFTLLPRQDGQRNGLVDSFELLLGDDGRHWRLAVAGRLSNELTRQTVEFPARYDASGRLLGRAHAARFVRLVVRSGHEGTHDVAIAQLDFLDAEDA